jgi:hypothetical protein
MECSTPTGKYSTARQGVQEAATSVAPPAAASMAWTRWTKGGRHHCAFKRKAKPPAKFRAVVGQLLVSCQTATLVLHSTRHGDRWPVRSTLVVSCQAHSSGYGWSKRANEFDAFIPHENRRGTRLEIEAAELAMRERNVATMMACMFLGQQANR